MQCLLTWRIFDEGSWEFSSLEAKENYHQVSHLNWVFLADAYVHVCVYMFVCDLLQSLEEESLSQFSDKILDLFFLSCHSSPFVSTLILLSTPKVKKNNPHITLSSQQKQFILPENVSDENSILSALSNQPMCCACLHSKPSFTFLIINHKMTYISLGCNTCTICSGLKGQYMHLATSRDIFSSDQRFKAHEPHFGIDYVLPTVNIMAHFPRTSRKFKENLIK